MNRVECPDCGRVFDNEIRAGSLEPYHMVMQSEHGNITTVPTHECWCSPGHARRGSWGDTLYHVLRGRIWRRNELE